MITTHVASSDVVKQTPWLISLQIQPSQKIKGNARMRWLSQAQNPV